MQRKENKSKDPISDITTDVLNQIQPSGWLEAISKAATNISTTTNISKDQLKTTANNIALGAGILLTAYQALYSGQYYTALLTAGLTTAVAANTGEFTAEKFAQRKQEASQAYGLFQQGYQIAAQKVSNSLAPTDYDETNRPAPKKSN